MTAVTATASAMKVTTTTVVASTAIEVPAAAVGEAERGAVSIVGRVGIVIRIVVVPVAPKASAAVPVSAVIPTPATTIGNLLHVRGQPVLLKLELQAVPRPA